jgi:N-acetyl-gamma-glutamyl-phosphate reductase
LANLDTIEKTAETGTATTFQNATLSRPPKIAIAGVSGYAGGELARLLLRHPGMEGTAPMFLGRAGESGDAVNTIESLHPQLAGIGTDTTHPVQPFHWDRLADAGTEILFLALPHEQSREWAPEAIARGIRVIDLVERGVSRTTRTAPSISCTMPTRKLPPGCRKKPSMAILSFIAMRSARHG